MYIRLWSWWSHPLTISTLGHWASDETWVCLTTGHFQVHFLAALFICFLYEISQQQDNRYLNILLKNLCYQWMKRINYIVIARFSNICEQNSQCMNLNGLFKKQLFWLTLFYHHEKLSTQCFDNQLRCITRIKFHAMRLLLNRSHC